MIRINQSASTRVINIESWLFRYLCDSDMVVHVSVLQMACVVS
jgi:hypothetical protein